VKTQGGILDLVLREVEIECLPGDIPSHIDLDVTEMSIGDVRRVSDLPHSDKLKFLTDEGATVAHVVSIKEEVAPAAEEVAAVTAPAEPEVVKKGKTDAAEAPTEKGAKK
jgi:large subunit ribosomal protein L25